MSNISTTGATCSPTTKLVPIGFVVPAAIGVIVDGVLVVIGELVIERDGVRLEANHRLHGAKIGHLRGGVPRGPRGQLITFDEYNVSDAFLGEVIEGAAPGNTATNNGDARV